MKRFILIAGLLICSNAWAEEVFLDCGTMRFSINTEIGVGTFIGFFGEQMTTTIEMTEDEFFITHLSWADSDMYGEAATIKTTINKGSLEYDSKLFGMVKTGNCKYSTKPIDIEINNEEEKVDSNNKLTRKDVTLACLEIMATFPAAAYPEFINPYEYKDFERVKIHLEINDKARDSGQYDYSDDDIELELISMSAMHTTWHLVGATPNLKTNGNIFYKREAEERCIKDLMKKFKIKLRN
jgi:hypothetical protein